uniref:Xin actin-binding repeat-containing protein 2 n=1 Tax=Oncorhynchus tshawytscha TaxID=74940 RepID=A0A8C8EN55_ONCTS
MFAFNFVSENMSGTSNDPNHYFLPKKIGRADINRSQWASNVSQKQVSTSEIHNLSSSNIQNFSPSEINNVSSSEIWEDSATEAIEDTSAVAVDYENTEYFPPPPPEDLEYLPPPPPDLLQVPSESPDMPVECYYSPEPPESAYPSKRPLSRQEYSRQRNQYELKRLYKHIHPEVRKNIEMYSDVMIVGSDVKSKAWMFETKPMDMLGSDNIEDGSSTIYMLEYQYMETLGHTETIDDSHLLSLRSGDTRTSTWLFDTQALDMTNRLPAPVKLVCSLSMEDNYKGDVYRGRWLFETKTLDSINKDEWESSTLQKEEIIGADVRKHCLAFETQPMDSLKDDSNARPPTIEDVIGGNVRSARHFFETSPKAALKDINEVGRLKKVVAAEEEKGDVRHQKWMFENERLENIRDEKKETIRTVNFENLTEEEGTSYNADVRKNCMVFETQPMDTLKDDSNVRAFSKTEIVRGNVRSAKHYFETAPADNLKDLAEVGKLQKMVRLDEEKGDVRHQKWVFESQPLEHIKEEKKEVVRTINLEEIDKVDVSNYKQIFETTDLTRWDESQKILVEGVTCGSVKSNKHLFESTPMYAMQDSSGHYHEVKTVHREEVVKGDVTSCKWMFETRPIDQFDESITNYQIIKGISKEVESGDVKTAKWLFETQPLDAIKYFSNIEDEETTTKESVEIVKGDVKTGKWLFETKLMNVPYEKEELKSENESEEVHKGDVKTCTWLFETKALDTIRDETETVLQTCTVNQEDVQGKDVRMARFLFETEKLENITGEDESFKKVTDIDIQSGDVNRIKYIFENQSSDIMTSTSEEVMQMLKTTQSEDIQKGNVGNCKWLFENQSIDAIHDTQEEALETRTVMDVQGGNVDKGRFIFETYSLDKIQEVSSETNITKLQKITREEEEKGDVRNYTMMFETQPLYAIQDKQGHYHEVTTVTSEEILKGDVIGSRWLFETKPLDSIRDTDEVYIIKSVTQEDVQKGDVTSAKWRFETQPLDKIAEDIKMSVKTVEDIQGGDVRMNKQRFESDELSQKSVRTVNVSEIQKGDVRTAKWMFETQTMDKIRSQSEENLIETVMKEEVLKGDVRQSVWLFEQNPLDHIKEVDEDNTVVVQEEIPKADVKTTTWLFETTPFHDFNENSVEKSEILGKSIKGTLEELYSQKIVNSKGILIEADEIGDVRMAKYQLMNTDSPEIQREEIISGDLNNIMMNLLNRRETIERGVVVESEEKGNISTTVHQLFNQERGINVEKEEILRGDIQEAVNNLLKEGGSAKRGILLQEDEKGDVQMTIYSLLNKQEDISVDKEDIIKGNIRNALQRLSNPENQEQMRIKVDETEKGNVNFYSTCIESGALDYLKQLQVEPDETPPEKIEKEEIIRGDIKGTKLILGSSRAQIERTVVEEDIVCGDVRKSVKVFMSEPTHSLDGLQKEQIVRGDLKAAMNSLSQSVNQTVVVEKEEVVRGNIHETRRHLECAHRRPKEVEKTEIVHGNIKGALKSLEKSATSKVEVVIEDLVPGDIKGTLKSLEQAKQTVRAIEKEEIVKGNIHTAKQCLRDASNDRRTCQQEIDVQGNVRGTIELLLEPPASPRMTRRPSFEGDVKMSIKSLYETHEVHETGEEQTQPEKEEVIKGDVKGTIKSLLESAQRAAPKIRVGARRVKVPVKSPLRSQHGSPLSRSQQGSPECSVATKAESETLKNKYQSIEAQRNIQKIKTANSAKTESSTQENQSLSTQTATNASESQTTQQSKTVMQHTTITQNHGIKTLETKFRNLNSSRKGMIRLDKTKVKTNVHTPTRTLSESELSLPPPPPPCDDQSSLTPASSINRLDLDLPPPPTPPPPPPVDSEPDHFPPPPQDFLPPPPSQHELDSMPYQTPHPSPAKATKMMVKKVKGPALHQVSKLEPTGQIQKIQQATSEKHTTTANKSVLEISKTQNELTVLSEIPKPPESPRPLKKVYVAPIRFTPPPSPPPFMRSTKFKTPLIQAEEKYRKQKVDSTPPATPSPIFMHESVTAALEMLSTEEAGMKQSKKSMAFGFTQDVAEKTVTNVKSDTLSSDLSKQAQISDTPSTLISAVYGKNLLESAVISATKQHIVSDQTSKVVSVQHQTTSISSTKQQTVTATKQQVTSASAKHSHSAVSNSQVQILSSDAKKVENTKADVQNFKVYSQGTKTDVQKDVKNKGSHKSEEKKNKDNSASQVPEKVSDQPTDTVKGIQETNVKAAKSTSEDKNKNDNSVSQAPEKVANQPIKVEKLTPETNVKSGKKKKARGIEKQVEVKETKQPDETKTENISQVKDVKVEVKEVTKLKVSSEQTHAQTDVKVKEDSQKAPAIKDNQPATPTSARKKKKKKSKAKDAAATTESTKSLSESSTQSQEMQTAHQEEQIQVHKEVIITESKVERKVHQSVQQQGTVKVEKQVKPSQKKKELTGSQQIQEKPKEEYRNVPVKVESGKMTNMSAQKEPARPSTESTEDSQRREHAQELISHITELEGASGKIDSKSVKTLLNTIPQWLIGPEENLYLEGTAVEHNIQKLTEIVSYVKKLAKAKLMCLEGIHTNLERHECEPASKKIIVGGATQRIHKISIGSLKVESQKKVVESKATSHESKMQELSVKSMRSPSPLLRMRSPSPTFITIESTRRTDSPQRITPSPILTHRPATPPTPPPRKSETPTTRINRATPSPTFSRAENLARLKDTTAKLSRGVTPPPVLLPMQVTEKKSEIVESPASFHRQIKIEAQAEGTSEVSDATIVTQDAQKADVKVTDKESFHQTDKEVMEASEMSDSSMVTMSVRNKREFFEDAQKAEVNKTNVRKDPIDIPEHLGPDREEHKTTNQESKDDTQSTSEKVTENNAEIVGSAKSTDKELMEASKMSNSLAATTSVRDKREFFEEAHKAKVNKTYVRRDPIDIPERLGPDMEELKPENQENEKEDLPKVDLSGLVNKFETPEDKVYVRKPITMRERRGSEMEYTETENTVIQEQEMPTFDIKAIKNVFEMVEQSPSFKGEKNKQEELEGFRQISPLPSQKESVTEHFSSLDEFGNKTIGSLSSTTVSQHSESTITHHAPFSYADVVKKKRGSEVTPSESPEEASTEELLRNFHKTWMESESVFKSLGYSVSEERTSHVVSHQTKTVVTGKDRLRLGLGEGLANMLSSCKEAKK